MAAGVRVVPLVGAEPAHEEEGDAHPDVGAHHVDPHFHREGRQEGEQRGHFGRRFLEENADARVHERHGEVDRLLARGRDGQVHDGDVGFLKINEIIASLQKGKQLLSKL